MNIFKTYLLTFHEEFDRYFIKIILLTVCYLSFTLVTHSQICTIKIVELQGEYIGDCKKGMADGKGKAKGIDMYEGEFKKGNPNGYGKYTWQNGSYYQGNWKNGLYDGQGTLSKISSEKNDTINLTGIWAKGIYKGIHKKPFEVNNYSNKISSIDINGNTKSGDKITITLKSITGGGSTIMGGSAVKIDSASILNNSIAKPTLTEIEIQTGSYSSKIEDKFSPISNKYTLLNVTFPIRMLLAIGSERVMVEIFEKGTWNISIMVDK